MSIEILIQKENENYFFTNSGELTAYFYSTKKILAHYMSQKQGLNSTVIQQKLTNLQLFLSENFSQLDDYLNKINLLAQYVGEINSVALASFFGKQFLPILEQVKQQLLDREIPKYRDRFENPLRTPSYDFLDEFETIFIQANPLIWPPPPKIETKLADPHPPLLDREIKVEIQTPALGVVLLELYETLFINSEPLGLPLQSELMHKKEDNTEAIRLDALAQQVSFKEYVQLLNTLSKYIKNKDNQGYQRWLSQLEPRLNCLIHLNQLTAKEEKNQTIDWARQISSLGEHLYLDLDHLKKIKSEVIKYRTTLTTLKTILQKLPPDVHQLYSQLIILLDKKDNVDSKKAILKITLLQVVDSSLKEELYLKISELIDNLDA